jgi:hypothetical protein
MLTVIENVTAVIAEAIAAAIIISRLSVILVMLIPNI